MNIFVKHIFFILVLAILLTGSTIAEVRVSAQVDSQKDIYVGESFGYYIVIDGADKQGQVDLGPLQKYNPQSAGSRKQSSTNIINNNITQRITTIMTYALTVNQPGPIELPSVTVNIDGKTYNTNPVTVNILKPGTTDKLELDVTLSEKKCYVGQPIVLTVRFYRYANIGDYQFNIPVLNSDNFYVEEPDDTTGQGKQDRLTKNGREAILFTFSKILIPKHAGKIEMEPASISAELVVGQSRSRDRFFGDFFGPQKQYKRFMVTSEPLTLTVVSLPEKDKPDGFYGLVGQYTISASAKPTTDVYMGDPITLTIKIGGGKYLRPVQWPNLEKVPELAANFKIPTQKASPTITGGFKVFTQTIRPDNNQANVIPSIPLAYFEPDSGSYKVAKTEPIKLDLKPSKRLTTADIEGKDSAPINKEVEAIKKGLSANYESPEVLKNMAFSPASALISPVYASVWAVPLGILILSLLVKLLTYTNPEKIAAKRRRQACSKAMAKLRKITSMDSSQQNERVVSAMKRYIGDRFDKIAGSLTSNDCYDIITNTTEDTEIADKYRKIIEHCESARYASIDVNIDSGKTKDIIELIRNIEKKSKK